jgi:hypothetical protein
MSEREPAECGCICVHCRADDHPTSCRCHLSNRLYVQIVCPEVSGQPLLILPVDLDKLNETGYISVTVDRKFLKTVGEMAEWVNPQFVEPWSVEGSEPIGSLYGRPVHVSDAWPWNK